MLALLRLAVTLALLALAWRGLWWAPLVLLALLALDVELLCHARGTDQRRALNVWNMALASRQQRRALQRKSR